MSSYLVDRIMDAENVELLTNIEVRELIGEVHLKGIVVEDNRSGAHRILGAQALFVFIGADVNTGWLEGAIELDERGSVLASRALDSSPLEEDAWQGLSREPYPVGDEPAGRIRGGRRAQWLDQAGRLPSRRGLYGGEVSPSVPSAGSREVLGNEL